MERHLESLRHFGVISSPFAQSEFKATEIEMLAGSLRQSYQTNAFSNLCRLSVGRIGYALSLNQAVEWTKNAVRPHRNDQISTQNSGANRAV